MSTDWDGRRRDLTREDIDAILAFLPFFEQSDVCFGEWHPYRDLRTGKEIALGYATYHPTLDAFVVALYEHNWMYVFDYLNPAWQRRMFALRDDPARMARTRLATLRKMLITYARVDRFVEGELAVAAEQGYLLAILRRVAQITANRH